MNFIKKLLNIDNGKESFLAQSNLEKQTHPLLYYIRHRNLKMVTKLLQEGADPNNKGEDCRNALALFFCTQNLDCAKVLLEHGADPHLLYQRESLSFNAVIYPCDFTTQEKAWIHNKESYDLLKQFNTDFTVRDSISKETLEERFQRYLPSKKFLKKFK